MFKYTVKLNLLKYVSVYCSWKIGAWLTFHFFHFFGINFCFNLQNRPTFVVCCRGGWRHSNVDISKPMHSILETSSEVGVHIVVSHSTSYYMWHIIQIHEWSEYGKWPVCPLADATTKCSQVFIYLQISDTYYLNTAQGDTEKPKPIADSKAKWCQCYCILTFNRKKI